MDIIFLFGISVHNSAVFRLKYFGGATRLRFRSDYEAYLFPLFRILCHNLYAKGFY